MKESCQAFTFRHLQIPSSARPSWLCRSVSKRQEFHHEKQIQYCLQFFVFLVRRSFIDSSVNHQHSRHTIMLSLSHKSQHRHEEKEHGTARISHVWICRKDDGRNFCHWFPDGNLHSILRRHRRSQSSHHIKNIRRSKLQPRLSSTIPYHSDNINMRDSALLSKEHRIVVVRLSSINWILRLPHDQDCL